MSTVDDLMAMSDLPPLPPPDRGTIRVGREDITMGHSDEAMLAYGQACAAAERMACAELVRKLRPCNRGDCDDLAGAIIARGKT